MGKIEKDKFQKLIENIVSEHYNDETISLDLYFDENYQKLENQKDITSVNQEKGGEFEFGDSIIEVLKFLTVMAGTFKAGMELLKLYKSSKQKKEVKVAEIWKNDLVGAGLDEEQATAISQKFESEFKKMIA